MIGSTPDFEQSVIAYVVPSLAKAPHMNVVELLLDKLLNVVDRIVVVDMEGVIVSRDRGWGAVAVTLASNQLDR